MQASKFCGKLATTAQKSSTARQFLGKNALISFQVRGIRQPLIMFKGKRLPHDKTRGIDEAHEEPHAEQATSGEVSNAPIDFWELPERFENLKYLEHDVELVHQGANDDVRHWEDITLDQ
ncbi:unnamed protein product [Moneuplotes crassus]|uniref:Uncharacterized protein n=1 Tax=Euplotes crassus TaxID=5936 RepID=A0AAD1Y2E9_EUPCR|nr:unnamed protein product [Moneuplotes crassus]